MLKSIQTDVFKKEDRYPSSKFNMVGPLYHLLFSRSQYWVVREIYIFFQLFSTVYRKYERISEV